MIDSARTLFRIRLAIGLVIVGLVASGLSAFPLLAELEILVNLTSQHAKIAPLAAWMVTVRDGLRATYQAYPFVAYGTDWLAFGHLVIALFFVGPLLDPARNIFVLYAGVWACVLVIPLALICGPVREVPFFWRLVDCAFGVLGVIPLLYAIRLTRRLSAMSWTRFIIP